MLATTTVSLRFGWAQQLLSGWRSLQVRSGIGPLAIKRLQWASNGVRVSNLWLFVIHFLVNCLASKRAVSQTPPVLGYCQLDRRTKSQFIAHFLDQCSGVLTRSKHRLRRCHLEHVPNRSSGAAKPLQK